MAVPVLELYGWVNQYVLYVMETFYGCLEAMTCSLCPSRAMLAPT